MVALRVDSSSLHKIILTGLIAIPVALFFVFNGPQGFQRAGAPEGQLFYLSSKVLGLCAFTVLWWQFLTTLLARQGQLPSRYVPGKRMHIVLGLVLLVLGLLHVTTFVAAASLRSGYLAWQLLVPTFSKGYYVTAVALGIIALLLVLTATAAGLLRKRLPGSWKWGHMPVFGAVVLVCIHAYMIGSEMQSILFLPMFWFVVMSLGTVGMLQAYRMVKSKI